MRSKFTVLERRTMLEDFYNLTDRWIDWHWSFYHDFGIDYFSQPEDEGNMLTPWQGYYMWVNISALTPGTEKLGLQFFRNPHGAITE